MELKFQKVHTVHLDHVTSSRGYMYKLCNIIKRGSIILGVKTNLVRKSSIRRYWKYTRKIYSVIR